MPMPRLERRMKREAREVRHAGIVRLATSIRDPVLRLRFLRMAAPGTSRARKLSRKRLGRWILWGAVLLALLIPFLVRLAADKPELPHLPPKPAATLPAGPLPTADRREAVPVWLVEQSVDSEIYSNGLRVDTRFTVPNRPRLYIAFERQGASSRIRQRRSQPAGIVYHISESSQAPFAAQDTPVLKRLGESLLEYIRRERSYHYLIDRFGRVYRVVAESDTAYHAGYSVWADDQFFYVNLNDSFLGISFEAHTDAAQSGEIVNPAQVRAGAVLTEMLRSRYRIPAGNCVTHAQVSVNPSNMLVGYHTDWAAGFPFAEIGLPDNYQRALPSLWAFGFSCEPAWRAGNGDGIESGVQLAEQEILRRSSSAGISPAAYRKTLRKQYRAWLAEARKGA